MTEGCEQVRATSVRAKTPRDPSIVHLFYGFAQTELNSLASLSRANSCNVTRDRVRRRRVPHNPEYCNWRCRRNRAPAPWLQNHLKFARPHASDWPGRDGLPTDTHGTARVTSKN